MTDWEPYIYVPYIPLYVSPTIERSDLDWRRRMLGKGQKFPILIAEVREALKKNREEHIEIVEEAQAGFKELVVKKLDEALSDAKKGKRYITSLNLHMPESHLREFDNAIDFLESIEKAAKIAGEENPTIEMSSEEYERFVRNKWDWMRNFTASNARYSAKARELTEAL